ncbi:MAG: hypothetical protein PW792_05255 [Acidobacteriaceae bacterium]|nr:hypothetical protein [Acidobacteriaceae bacterium]
MPSFSLFGRLLVPATALTLSLLAGCSTGLSPTVSGGNSFVQGGAMSGNVHGGNQPIIGATVTLYAAGTSGYGSTATAYAVTTSAAPSGNFAFTQLTPGSSPTSGPVTPLTSSYTCPTGNTADSDPQMYLVARGGETQGVGNGTNSAAAFVIALGKCSTVASLLVNMNEVTSVATMAGLQQYFNPATESFGYPNTAQAATGFANGVAAISNLANIATGAAVTSNTSTATPDGSSSNITVTITPETTKVNLLANILAACVNNTSNAASACTTLFASAVPPVASFTSQPMQDFSTITAENEDTVQALYFMLTNPSSGQSATNMNALFDLPTGVAPFQPTYSTAPTDWTVGVFYSSTNTCTLKSGAGTTSTAKFLNGVNNPTIDANGNVWGANIATAGNLFEISSTGTPLTCGLGGAAPIATGLTIDPAGYVWVASGSKVDSNYNLLKWSPTASTLDSTWITSSTAAPQAIVADGHGNIFYSASTSPTTFSTTAGSVNELAGAGVAGSTPTNISTQQIATVFSLPTFMAVDSSDNLWVAIVHVGTPSAEGFFQIYPSNDTTAATYASGTSDGTHAGFETSNIATLSANLTGSTPTIYNPYGVAVGPNGIIYSANGAGSGSAGNSYRWSTVTPTAATPGQATASVSAVGFGGILSTRGVAVDGAGNQWEGNTTAATGNWVSGATTSGLFSVSEVSAAGDALSPTSASGTGGYGVSTGGFQKPATLLPLGVRGLAVDPTGNVWIGQNSSTGTGILELVGAGVPLVTPLSVGAANGTLGMKP